MLILLVFILLCFIFTPKKSSAKTDKTKDKAPQPKDFNNYYVYKSALSEYNENQYDEFLEECKKGKCTYIEKEIISHETEKSNEIINELKTKL